MADTTVKAGDRVTVDHPKWDREYTGTVEHVAVSGLVCVAVESSSKGGKVGKGYTVTVRPGAVGPA